MRSTAGWMDALCMTVACGVSATAFIQAMIAHQGAGLVLGSRVQLVRVLDDGRRDFAVYWHGAATRVEAACECVQIRTVDYLAGRADVSVRCEQARGYEPGVVIFGGDGSRHFARCPCGRN